MCFFDDPYQKNYSIEDFKTSLNHEYGSCLPAPAFEALFDLQDGDNLVVLQNCLGKLFQVVARNRNQCVVLRPVMNRQDIDSLINYRANRISCDNHINVLKPLSKETIDGLHRGRDALRRIYLEKTGRIRSPSPPRDLR